MRVLVDTNALIYLLDRAPKDELRVRLEGLVTEIEETKGFLIIPTPVIAEYLVHADTAREALLQALVQSRFVRVEPFDLKAAYECADMDSRARNGGNKRAPLGATANLQKVKVDRQIVAIAKSRNASVVGGDADVIAICGWAGVHHKAVMDLPIPQSAAQRQIELVGGGVKGQPIAAARSPA